MAPTLNPKGDRCGMGGRCCRRRLSWLAWQKPVSHAHHQTHPCTHQHAPHISSHTPHCCSQPDAVERLLVRLLPRPSERTVFAGDVVAFTSPFTAAAVAGVGGMGGVLGAAGSALGPEALQNTMVRRVAAMPGDELVAGEGEEDEEAIVVPEVRPGARCQACRAALCLAVLCCAVLCCALLRRFLEMP